MTAAEDVDELDVVAGVAVWARPFLAVVDVPPFGTADWLALSVTDQRRPAAVVRDALSWWRVGEPLDDLEQRAQAALDVESSHAVAGALRWSGVAYRPMRAELAGRRDWHARRDRPDHLGGPVPAWGPNARGGVAS